MNNRRSFLLLLIVLTSLGCTASQYQWGNYESALYNYYKHPAAVEEYTEHLAHVITTGGTEGGVPPGLYAEYGYALLLQRKYDEAIAQFNREKQVWPESTQLMDIMINTATTDRGRKP